MDRKDVLWAPCSRVSACWAVKWVLVRCWPLLGGGLHGFSSCSCSCSCPGPHSPLPWPGPVSTHSATQTHVLRVQLSSQIVSNAALATQANSQSNQTEVDRFIFKAGVFTFIDAIWSKSVHLHLFQNSVYWGYLKSKGKTWMYSLFLFFMVFFFFAVNCVTYTWDFLSFTYSSCQKYLADFPSKDVWSCIFVLNNCCYYLRCEPPRSTSSCGLRAEHPSFLIPAEYLANATTGYLGRCIWNVTNH